MDPAGETAPDEEELPALFDQILHARYDFPSPWWDNISADGKDLVKKLSTNLDSRAGDEAHQAWQHPRVRRNLAGRVF